MEHISVRSQMQIVKKVGELGIGSPMPFP